MLTEERYSEIVKLVNEKKAVTVTELTKLLHSSESTIRRDLTALHNLKKLNKVHGGATSLSKNYTTHEDAVSVKYHKNREEKIRIAQLAAKLIQPNDFIYLDAGTSTEQMIDYFTEKGVVFVTNGIPLAKKLAQQGFKTFIISGMVKSTTEAVIGSEATKNLASYNFTKGFFGTNGVDLKEGFTTPDIDEARTKTEAMRRCRECYVLADPSKFDQISSISFAALPEAEILTTKLSDPAYAAETNILEVDTL